MCLRIFSNPRAQSFKFLLSLNHLNIEIIFRIFQYFSTSEKKIAIALYQDFVEIVFSKRMFWKILMAAYRNRSLGALDKSGHWPHGMFDFFTLSLHYA